MAFLGNSSSSANYVPQTDFFSGDGSTVAFTLSRAVVSAYQVEAVVANVIQNPSDAFTVSGNVITFTSAPPAGTNNVYVRYATLNTTLLQPGQGTVYPAALSSGGINWDANGNVGIGAVGSAGGKLVVAGTSGVPQAVFGTSANSWAANVFDNSSAYFTAGGSNIAAVGMGAAANVPLSLFTNNTERLRIGTDGLLTVNSGQIKFPATQNASSNANTLDDYEEGTWSPTFSFAVSGDASNCAYTKVGRLVTLTFYIQAARTSSPAGDFNMGGLPFAMATGPDNGAGAMLPYNVSMPNALGVWRRYGDTSLGILSGATGVTWSWTQNGAFSTGLFAVAGQFSYIAA